MNTIANYALTAEERDALVRQGLIRLPRSKTASELASDHRQENIRRAKATAERVRAWHERKRQETINPPLTHPESDATQLQ